jgi:hypothetical protein
MAIYNKYDGNITYIPVSSQEWRELGKPFENRSTKYLLTRSLGITKEDFLLIYGHEMFMPSIDTNNTIEMHFPKDYRLDDFLEFIKNTVYVAKHAMHKNDMAVLNKIASYMYDKFNIIL